MIAMSVEWTLGAIFGAAPAKPDAPDGVAAVGRIDVVIGVVDGNWKRSSCGGGV
jgi:hypothetical protein